MKTTNMGSKVTVEVFLGRVEYDGNTRRRHLEYERFRRDENYTETYILCNSPGTEELREISFDSFIGRALMGTGMGQEVEVNVGGLPINELRDGTLSGNRLKFKILSIE
mgnify:CR=1 FL=1